MAVAHGYRIKVTGIVQGVGFRPHVYRLALEHNLKGWILNSSTGVYIEVEGDDADLRGFLRRLEEEPPPLALIRSCQIEEIAAQGYESFSIRRSAEEEVKTAMISPDIAICADCQREVSNPLDRRYGYPFINCTNCGPRYTIIKDIPYDRPYTTMADFPMCPECLEEYHNPLNRRFHAQPNACPTCGPHTELVDDSGQAVGGAAVDLLKAGKIIAIKGLGGFHLTVDAKNGVAVENLRQRKRRDAKPFAVMARDLAAAHNYARINPAEEKRLASPQAPIVILESKNHPEVDAAVIHPGLSTLGVMLPYTPLHYLLFDDEIDLLIMTSANISDEPLITTNEAALTQLKGIADYYLLHDREIYNPCDDSVIRVNQSGVTQYIRRARGFVPLAIALPFGSHAVLAVGGEMKNTFCITRRGEAYLSQHWGDLNHYRNYDNFLQGIERFEKMLDITPQVIAHDLHPNYQSTRWALQQGIATVAVQHHHAHMAAAMAENGLRGEVLGLICDGTGWGIDGTVWGGEILQGDYRGFQRRGHLKLAPLPGGDRAAQKPYRMALVYLAQALGAREAFKLAAEHLPDLSREESGLILKRMAEGRETYTSSCGRLFEAVSAILNICTVNRYEGQAAIELEARALPDVDEYYHYGIDKRNGIWIIDPTPLWLDILADMKQGLPVGEIAARFHQTVIRMFHDALVKVRTDCGLNRIVLSGGVFHNEIIFNGLLKSLQTSGFEVFYHRLVPPGDGGIALGQAAIASEVIS